MAASAGTAFTALAIGAANSADEITRFSRLSSTNAQQFQEWAAGAATVGIEQGKLADILKDVNDRVGDFLSTGGGPMADFFEEIAPKVGVTADQFRGLSGPDALQLYVDTLQKAGVNQQQFTFYMEAMASEATVLLPLLKDGGKGMAEYAARAQKVGAIMSGETLQGLNAAKDAMREMSLAATGMRNSLGAIAAPAIVALGAAVTAVATVINENAGMISDVLNTMIGTAVVAATVFAGRYAVSVGVTAVQAMAKAVAQSVALEMALGAQSRVSALASAGIKGLAGAFAVLRRAIISTGFGALIVGAGWLLGKFVELVRATGGFGNALALLRDVAVGVWDGIKTSAKSIPAALASIWKLVRSSFFSLMSGLAEAWSRFLGGLGADLEASVVPGVAAIGRSVSAVSGLAAAEMAEYDAKAQAAASASARLRKEAGALASSGFGKAKEALKALNLEVIEVEKNTEEAETSVTDFGTSAGGKGGAAEKLTKLQEVMKRLKEEAAELAATLNMSDLDADIWRNQREAGVSVDSGAGRAIAEQTRINDGLKRLKQSTEDWRKSITGAFKDFVTGAASFKDMLGQILGKLADIVLDNAFQSIFKGSSGWLGGILSGLGIGANATGTDYWRGGLTSINERGGEIVDLPRGTRIIPHGLSKRMMEGAGQNVHVTVGVSADNNGNLMPFVAGVSTRVMSAGSKAQQRQLGGNLSAYQERGTTG
ncbi:hypothetical protein ACRARG_12555 [Pseudooceanicola sp. C21-150M6]|uniref:hypothetical protein n=1 Tax=Pseudooceanicola sp. C21-150M6 TaxID=3434355 RepID=UPI003D7FB145